MKQTPECGEYVVRWHGDRLAVSLEMASAREGRAVFRTNVSGIWTDVEMRRQPLRFYICILPKSARVRSGNFIPFTKITQKQKNRIDNPKESDTIHLTFRQML